MREFDFRIDVILMECSKLGTNIKFVFDFSLPMLWCILCELVGPPVEATVISDQTLLCYCTVSMRGKSPYTHPPNKHK